VGTDNNLKKGTFCFFGRNALSKSHHPPKTQNVPFFVPVPTGCNPWALNHDQQMATDRDFTQMTATAFRIVRVLPAAVLTIGVVAQQACGRLGTQTHGNAEMSLGTFPELNPVANHKSRVYAYWVNGNEGLFYRGDAQALNEVLAAFAAAPLERHEVVLRPGPQSIDDFQRNPIAYDWRLDVIGGIDAHMATTDKGDRFWPKFPVLTVCIDGERIELTDIVIPDGVHIVQLSDLRERYLDGLSSTDRTVRGWGTGQLSRLDQYDINDAANVAGMLNDQDDWVRLNAAGAIAGYGATAKPLLPKFRESLRRETAENVKTRLAESIEAIEAAVEDPKQAALHWSLVRLIDVFCGHRPAEHK
jgi:hypothetical protein